MKAIINGRIYNTTTATRVASYDSGLGGNFRDFSESLYITKRGRWFLAGEGGPDSPYRRRCGDMWAAGSKITAIEPEMAQEWLERYGHTEELEQYFADKLQEA